MTSCKECGAFSGKYNICADHIDMDLFTTTCNICCGPIFCDYNNFGTIFLCKICCLTFRAWFISLIEGKDFVVFSDEFHPYYSRDFPGFVTYDGTTTYYSKPDLSLMNIDLKSFYDNWNIDNKAIEILRENGIDMTEKIQIRIKKPKSAKSNISFIEK